MVSVSSFALQENRYENHIVPLLVGALRFWLPVLGALQRSSRRHAAGVRGRLPPASPVMGDRAISREGASIVSLEAPSSASTRSTRGGGRARSVSAGFARSLRADAVDEVLPVLRRPWSARAEGLHAAGFVAYEAAPAFDPALATIPRSAPSPRLVRAVRRGATTSSRLDAARGGGAGRAGAGRGRGRLRGARRAHARADRGGRHLQVNYTFGCARRFAGDDVALLRAAAARRSAPRFGAYLDAGRVRDRLGLARAVLPPPGRRARAAADEGDRPRGRWPEEDGALAARAGRVAEGARREPDDRGPAAKRRGRVAEIGSVRVSGLFEVERYPTVLADDLDRRGARSAPDATLGGRLRARSSPAARSPARPRCAPSRIIAELEDEPRGVYCGAIGFVVAGRRSGLQRRHPHAA